MHYLWISLEAGERYEQIRKTEMILAENFVADFLQLKI